jgi:hypothetical protein
VVNCEVPEAFHSVDARSAMLVVVEEGNKPADVVENNVP